MCGIAGSPNGAREAAGLGDPREKGNLGEKYEAEPGRSAADHAAWRFAESHMHAAVQKVNGERLSALAIKAPRT